MPASIPSPFSPFFYPSSWGLLQSTCWTLSQTPPLTARTAVVTGGSSGLGSELVLQLLLHNISAVYVLSRSETRYMETRTHYWLPALSAAGVDVRIQNVYFVPVDLSDLRAVKDIADELCRRVEHIDILFCNAAMDISTPPSVATGCGVEKTFAVSHLGHFVLVDRLLPFLKRVPGGYAGRIVVASSSFHMFCQRLNYSALTAPGQHTNWIRAVDAITRYSACKLANLLFTTELARRLRAKNCAAVTVNAYFPGNVLTPAMEAWDELLGPTLGDVVKWCAGVFGQSLREGVTTAMFLGTALEAEGVSGKYYVPVAYRAQPAAQACDLDEARRLWVWSENVVRRAR